MKNKRAKVRARKAKARLDLYGPEYCAVSDAITGIHKAANLIRVRAYEIADIQAAKTPEYADVLKTELCRAMAIRAGERKLMYSPYRGPVLNDWTIGC